MMADPKFCPQCQEPLVERVIENRARLACPSRDCEYVHWDNPVPVVAAIVEHGGSVVLARNKMWPARMYGLITGFLEKGETCEEGVVREVGEELGLESEHIEFVGVYPFFEMNQIIVAYHVLAQGDIELGDELADVKCVPIEKVRPWRMGTGLALRDWLESRTEKG